MEIMNEIANIGVTIAPSIVRSFGGWATKSCEDGKIEPFEIKELTKTMVKVGVIGIATFYGLNGVGIDIAPMAAGFVAIVIDKIIDAIKTKK